MRCDSASNAVDVEPASRIGQSCSRSHRLFRRSGNSGGSGGRGGSHAWRIDRPGGSGRCGRGESGGGSSGPGSKRNWRFASSGGAKEARAPRKRAFADIGDAHVRSISRAAPLSNRSSAKNLAQLRDCKLDSRNIVALPGRANPWVFERLVRADGETCVGSVPIAAEWAPHESTIDVLANKPCSAPLGKFELTVARELRVSSTRGSLSCATATALRPLVHVFRKAAAEGHPFEVMIRHQHRAPISGLEFPLSWLGVPPNSDWDVRTFDEGDNPRLPTGSIRENEELRILSPIDPGEAVVLMRGHRARVRLT